MSTAMAALACGLPSSTTPTHSSSSGGGTKFGIFSGGTAQIFFKAASTSLAPSSAAGAGSGARTSGSAAEKNDAITARLLVPALMHTVVPPHWVSSAP